MKILLGIKGKEERKNGGLQGDNKSGPLGNKGTMGKWLAVS